LRAPRTRPEQWRRLLTWPSSILTWPTMIWCRRTFPTQAYRHSSSSYLDATLELVGSVGKMLMSRDRSPCTRRITCRRYAGQWTSRHLTAFASLYVALLSVKSKICHYNRPWSPTGLCNVTEPTLSRSRLTDGSKVVSPTHQPCSTPQKQYISASGTYFC
jgi:hypothetical protein